MKALGLGIGIGLASRRPRAWTPADAGASLLSWMRGDDPDAAINTTPTPHQYAAIPDRGALGGQYAQATSANQPQVSTDWTPGPVPFFTSGRRLSNGTASDATALHDGTSDVGLYGINCIPSLSGFSTILRSMGSFSASGVILHVTSAGVLQLQYGNGGGDSALTIQSVSGAISAGVAFCWAVIKRGPAVELFLGGTSIGSGTIATPSSGEPSGALTLGATLTGGNPLDGFMPEFLWFQGPAFPDRAAVENYLQRWSYTP